MSATVTEPLTGVTLADRIEELIDSLERTLQLAGEIGWVLGEDFEEQAGDCIGNLRCGDALRSTLWDLLYSASLGPDTPTEIGWSRMPEKFEDVRSVLAIVRRNNDGCAS